MEIDLRLLAMAVDSDFLSLTDLVRWADEQILQLDSPLNWICDLCLAKTKDEAMGILWTKWYPYMETGGHEWPDPASAGDLFVGFLYLRFERGDVTMAELLELAGRYSDATGCNIECGSFYTLLNEIDGGGPALPSNQPLEERVASLFAPMAMLARQGLGKMPGTEG